MKQTIIKLFIFIFSVFFIQTAWAGERIVDVDFKGLETVAETTLRPQIQSIEGTDLSKNQLGEDVKKLYKTGYFQDVKVEKQSVAGGVKITFQFQEKKIVGRLVIEGNKKIKKADIEEVLQIHEFENYDKSRIALTKSKIIGLYEEKGYFLADIDVETWPFDDDQNQVELRFKIHEGRSVKIRRVDFVGNRVFSDKALRKIMRSKEKNALSFLNSSGKLQDENFDMDLKLLAFYYQDHGYIDVRLGEPSVTLTRDRRSIYISVPINEGAQYKVESLDVVGDILTSKAELLSQFKQKPGEVYKKSLEFQDQQTVDRIYGDQAYINADFEPQIETHPETQTARITYNIRKNTKMRISKIIIKGNDVTRDKVIRREMRVYENSYISQSGLELSRKRLMQLGYFKEVNFSTPHADEADKVNLVVEVVENNTGDFNIGAGFSTLENFMLNARVRKDNFLGRGLSTTASILVSKLRQDFQLYYKDWYFLDSQWALTLNGFRYISSINPTYDQSNIGGSIGFGREVFDFLRADFEYSYSQVKVSNFASQVPEFFKRNANGALSSLGSVLSYDRRDNRITPKKGTYTALSFTYGDEWLGTDNPYTKTSLDNRFYIPLPLKFVFRGRQLAGYVNSLSEDPVQLTNRYYMGGPDSLRGYNWQSIGPSISLPRSAKGQDIFFPYGGDKILQLNLELEVPIYAEAGIYGVAFFDSGNAFAETENYNLTTLRHDYGFGLRWQSPIGPLRFEWGFPIDRKATEDSAVFNFMIGPNF